MGPANQPGLDQWPVRASVAAAVVIVGSRRQQQSHPREARQCRRQARADEDSVANCQ